ncbi:hypothetical protein GCM10023339_30410 [Alloalcanivorax gelatiniphagus]
MTARGARVAASLTCLVAAVLTSCGERSPDRPGGPGGPGGSDTTDTTAPAPGLPVTVVDGEVLVSCGGTAPGWPPSAMVDGITPPVPVAEIEAALSAAPVAHALRRDWKVLAADADELTLALGTWREDGPARDAQYLVLEPEADGWRASNGGSCWRLSPVLDADAIWVQVDASVAVAGDATEVAVDVKETACAGARDPLPHLAQPMLTADDEAVTVYWTSESPGAAGCPENPTARTTLTLDEPLGDRPLLDGSRWPPALIGQDE